MKDGEIYYAICSIGKNEDIFVHRTTGVCHKEISNNKFHNRLKRGFPESEEIIGICCEEIPNASRVIVSGDVLRHYTGGFWSSGEARGIVGYVARYPHYVPDGPTYNRETGEIVEEGE